MGWGRATGRFFFAAAAADDDDADDVVTPPRVHAPYRVDQHRTGARTRERTRVRERERERERKRLGYGPSPVCNLLVRDDKKKKKELVNRRDPLTKYLIGCWQPTSTDTALHQHVRFASLFLFRKRIFSASKSRVQPNPVVKGH